MGRRRSSERWDCYSGRGLQPTLIASLRGLHIARKPLSRRWPGTAMLRALPMTGTAGRGGAGEQREAKGAGAVRRGRFCASDDDDDWPPSTTSTCTSTATSTTATMGARRPQHAARAAALPVWCRAAPASAALAAALFVRCLAAASGKKQRHDSRCRRLPGPAATNEETASSRAGPPRAPARRPWQRIFLDSRCRIAQRSCPETRWTAVCLAAVCFSPAVSLISSPPSTCPLLVT
jgi:hypothetical protein